nr:Chain A, SINGLE INSULIN-LIKE GROWTH FACTOR-BINDING DOMAIN PROTEIN-1 [Cupiennius salei]3ZXB_B Chain B, SINGLE INSULIN-LIKE GROWTH FACTOR-BINDING DOMAIN PROTEIN-1 [Cupiennius salei]3ZXB_C Chain C, SINGLE INSULIN-LIKE GROWTH FACTOR-BINDING DOMAIN PROTEIN-1 [Cupiennius salei]3ZXB_D Chain D, SINGLE INSULIN-LIKE GROWTH FACTOR-BINDING DOMAIN PROTEIN-1 [Cupiennius salei]
FTCPECRPELCGDPGYCEYGTTKDACDCCPVCFQGPGGYCGGPEDVFGICADGFACVPLVGERDSQDPEIVGTCVKIP